jgi:FlaA1/EpsC-like NDP-sugar epimerase
MNNLFVGKNIIIFGATGSWGHELTKQLLEFNPKEIIVFSRGELAQVNMQRKFKSNKLKFIIGDVRDYSAVDNATRNVDYVFLLAALKHVPICENQPQEAIKTNINGTVNVINSAIKHKVKIVVDVSSDKACSPNNLYGMTKAVGEKLIIQANTLTEDTNLICVRGGNVLGSNGSVVPLFIDQIKRFNETTVTDGSMTRFFLTLPEAIKLLFQAVENSVGGEIYVMNMPAFFISDVAKVLIKHYGDSQTSIKEIGIREGEKMHEVLISEHESHRSYTFNKDYYVILPELSIDRNYEGLKANAKVTFSSFSSSNNVSDGVYLTELLDRGGFLV